MQRNLVAGAFWTPLVASIVYAGLLLSDPSIGKHFTNLELVRGFFLAIVPASYACCFALGAPLVYFLRRKQQLHFWMFTSISGSLAVGVLCVFMAAPLIVTDKPHRERFHWGAVLAGLAGTAAFGSFAGGVFCTISGITSRSIGRQNG